MKRCGEIDDEKEMKKERTKEKESLLKREKTNKARQIAGFAELPEITKAREEAKIKGTEKVRKYNEDNPAKIPYGTNYDMETCKVYQENVAGLASKMFSGGLRRRNKERRSAQKG